MSQRRVDTTVGDRGVVAVPTYRTVCHLTSSDDVIPASSLAFEQRLKMILDCAVVTRDISLFCFCFLSALEVFRQLILINFFFFIRQFHPLECKGNYSATSNYMKLVHWPLMSGLLYLVQRGGNWASVPITVGLLLYTVTVRPY